MESNKRKRSSDIMTRLISRKYQSFSFCEKDVQLKRAMNCVYFISDGRYIKIGKANFLDKRLSSLQTSNARELIPLCVCMFKNAQEVERYENRFHNYFSRKNIRGEWFDISESDIEKAKTYFGVEMYKVVK